MGKISPKTKTTVFLRRDTDQAKIFHCFTCCYPLFKYQGSITMVIPGDADKEQKVLVAPFEHECRGNSAKWGKCPCVYIIEGFVEQV